MNSHLTTDFESFFDPPLPDPPKAGPPYVGGVPTLAGELDPKMAGRPLKELCSKISGLSLEESEDLVYFGAMWLDDKQKSDPFLSLPATGEFRLNFPAYGPRRFYEIDEKRVVYEDRDVLVYDKESGRPSQAVPYDAYNNVLSGLTRARGIFLRLPHRLDLGTSGLLLVAKNQKAAGIIGKAFQEGQIKKRYLALCSGTKPDWTEKEAGAFIAKNGGKLLAREKGPGLPAKTIIRILGGESGRLFIQAAPLTGRTHQIRLHLSFLGLPIKGDSFYGGEKADRLMLRAAGLAFRRPSDGKAMILGEGFEEGFKP
jgi:23S rRNA pseudouridine1911/1915/1917 synthase